MVEVVGPWLWDKVFPEPKIDFAVDFLREGCGSYVVPSASGTSPSDPRFGYGEWLAEHEAAHADGTIPGRGTSRILVTVSSQQDRPVIVTSLTFRAVVQESKPLEGEVMEIPCGGAVEARFAEIDLDADPPTIVKSSEEAIAWGYDPSLRTTPLLFPYEVNSKDTELLSLVAYTAGYVEWTAELAWSDGQDSGRITIDNDGSPFRTSVLPDPAFVGVDS